VPNYIGLAMRAGVHVMITGRKPIQNTRMRVGGPTVRWPVIALYEFEPGSNQIGQSPPSDYLTNPPGDHSFPYRELCLETIDFGILTNSAGRVTGTGNNRRYCGITGTRTLTGQIRRDDGMRGGISTDPNFPSLTIRPEAGAPGRRFAPASESIEVELYNPPYFDQLCQYVPAPRPCFQPIFLLDCLDTADGHYRAPIAFWTSAFAHVVSPDIPNAVGARSVVYGFPPVFFNPNEVKPGIEYILFDEWQLPRKSVSGASASASR
jgi:hypothetical protein